MGDASQLGSITQNEHLALSGMQRPVIFLFSNHWKECVTWRGKIEVTRQLAAMKRSMACHPERFGTRTVATPARTRRLERFARKGSRRRRGNNSGSICPNNSTVNLAGRSQVQQNKQPPADGRLANCESSGHRTITKPRQKNAQIG